MPDHANAAQVTDLGVVQHPSDVLSTPTIPYDLPREADLAREHFIELRRVALEIFSMHSTRKGLGIAAPQIGLNRRIAFLRPWEGKEMCLLNPEIVDASQNTDLKFEGCLSLWDFRGRVSRPLSMTVRTHDYDGNVVEETYTNALARLVAHEIDHLDGKLYLDRLEEPPIPADEYRKLGNTDWTY